MILKIGRRFSLAVRDLHEASRFYQAVRNASGEGMNTFPNGRFNAPWSAYYVSYNGRVWIEGDGNETLVMEAAR